MQNPGDTEGGHDDQQGSGEDNAANAGARFTPRGVAGFPEEHDGQEDFEDDVRRQANTLNFVQFVGGHNTDSQANENQHNGGGDPRFVRDCAAYEDSEG